LANLIPGFPEIEDVTGLVGDINRFSQAQGRFNPATLPQDFPYLFRSSNKTWGGMADELVQRAEEALLPGLSAAVEDWPASPRS